MSIPLSRADATMSQDFLAQHSPEEPVTATTNRQKLELERLELQAKLVKAHAQILDLHSQVSRRQQTSRPRAKLLFQLSGGKWPQLRNNAPDWDPKLESTGIFGTYFIIPGVLNLAEMLHSTVWTGQPGPNTPRLRTRPMNGADIMVTVLYRHHPLTLREFFDKESFEFVHFSTDSENRQGPFAIVRRGECIEAGFPVSIKPIIPANDVSVSREWKQMFRYTMLKGGQWRAEYLSISRADEGDASKVTWALLEDDEEDQRRKFEDIAVRYLSAAIEQHRWKADKRNEEHIMIKAFSRD